MHRHVFHGPLLVRTGSRLIHRHTGFLFHMIVLLHFLLCRLFYLAGSRLGGPGFFSALTSAGCSSTANAVAVEAANIASMAASNVDFSFILFSNNLINVCAAINLYPIRVETPPF